MRVLLLVSEPWRSDDSGGNTLDNFFNGMEGVEFAHIYNSDQMPRNTVCHRYFQLSEKESYRSFFTRKRVGRVLRPEEYSNNEPQKNTGKNPRSISLKGRAIKFIKQIRPNSLLMIRQVLRRYSNWKTPELEAFVKEFDPDVIYAPCYASPFQLALTRHIKKMTGKNIVTWSADDCYSLRQFSLSPFFWLNRLWHRYCLRKTYPYYNEFYSISEEEAEELEPVVNRLREKSKMNCAPLKIGILRKGVVVPETFTPREVHNPIKFIYAGGLYLNRHKSLIAIANTLRKLNSNGSVKAELHIYTGSQLSDKDAALLNDGRSVYNHGLISPETLNKIYQDCDVAIHCESFDLKYRLMTRLSFSTKIIDCFQSGCAILAIAWKEHTGIKCLQRNDAAFCVTSVNDIEEAVTRIVENPELIKEYAMKAYECEKRNHRIEDVQKTLYDSLVRCAQ